MRILSCATLNRYSSVRLHEWSSLCARMLIFFTHNQFYFSFCILHLAATKNITPNKVHTTWALASEIAKSSVIISRDICKLEGKKILGLHQRLHQRLKCVVGIERPLYTYRSRNHSELLFRGVGGEVATQPWNWCAPGASILANFSAARFPCRTEGNGDWLNTYA